MNEMLAAIERLRFAVRTLPGVLAGFSEVESEQRPSPERWTKKEVLGHLIDSASNSHQRFVRGQIPVGRPCCAGGRHRRREDTPGLTGTWLGNDCDPAGTRLLPRAGDVDFGLLVCEPDLVPFYERLGWRRSPGELLVAQRQATVPFTFNLAMTTPIRLQEPLTGAIDLMGPPW
jgi:hypothetical protein